MKALFPLFALLFLLTGCSSTEQMLCRKWEIKEVSFSDNVTAKEATEAKAEFLKKKYALFSKDHTCSLGGDPSTGWQLNARKDTIYMQDEEKSFFIIRKLDKKNLILETGNSTNTYTTYLNAVK